MRITDSLRTRTVIQDLNLSRDRLTQLQEQLSTGKRVNRPSDDPLAVSRGLRLRTTLENNVQYGKNIDNTIGFLSTTEAALNDIHEIMVSVRELTLSGASDAIKSREDLADQLELVLQNLLEVSNAKFQGKYIFAGTETLAVPFTLDENVFNQNVSGDVVTYRGNDKTYDRQINENTIIDLNIPGSQVFDQRSTGGVSLFQTIWDLRDRLLSHDTDAIRGTLDEIDKGIDQVLQSFLEVGVRTQLANFNESRFSTQEILLKDQLSEVEDTDFGEAFVRFKAEENALNSALSAGARVISPSLLDYLK